VKEEFLGGKETYDNGTAKNTIGLYGCLFMAAVSVGGSIRVENKDETHSGSFIPNVNSLDYNIEKYFSFPANGKPNGTDVYVADLERLIGDVSGKKIKVETITSRFGANLKELALSEQSVHIIAEFKTDYGSHFEALDGISFGQYGSITLNYREQSDDFSQKFTMRDLISLRVVRVIE
jgi:hypothetical protein